MNDGMGNCAVQKNRVPAAAGTVATSHTNFLLNRVHTSFIKFSSSVYKLQKNWNQVQFKVPKNGRNCRNLVHGIKFLLEDDRNPNVCNLPNRNMLNANYSVNCRIAEYRIAYFYSENVQLFGFGRIFG